jgi:hypothetical protein
VGADSVSASALSIRFLVDFVMLTPLVTTDA